MRTNTSTTMTTLPTPDMRAPDWRHIKCQQHPAPGPVAAAMQLLRSAALVAIASLAISGCVSQTVRVVDMTPPKQLDQPMAEDLLLDVGVSVYDANIPDSYDERIERMVQPEIRRAEAQYMPYITKNLLQSTGNWGAVRVIPRTTHAVDVVITGRIIESNGERMIVETQVEDATGRVWFTKQYETLASKYAYDDAVPPDIDPFQSAYKNLADEMLAYRETLTEAEVRRIRATAEMKFAREFAKDAFASHVRENEAGQVELVRLPSEADPMLERVRKVREREYLFIDTLDEYYANFYRQMYPAYQDWRAATYDEAIAYRELTLQARTRTWMGIGAMAGSVLAIYESSDPYVDASGVAGVVAGASLLKSSILKRHEARMHAEVLEELGVAAQDEVVPHTIELENQVVRLEGSVDQQYQELRKILRRLYFEDLGLDAPDNADAATASTAPAADAGAAGEAADLLDTVEAQ